MPDGYVINLMRGQRDDLREQLRQPGLTTKEIVEILADIKDVEDKLEHLGVDLSGATDESERRDLYVMGMGG